jgi:hypothetical protein
MRSQLCTQLWWDDSSKTERICTVLYDRWWYGFEGQRCYHDCKEQTSDSNQEASEYTELLTDAYRMCRIEFSSIQVSKLRLEMKHHVQYRSREDKKETYNSGCSLVRHVLPFNHAYNCAGK